MHLKGIYASVLAVGLAFGAFGSGFSLYEPSALSVGMGGALVGKAMDASANYNNPATLTDLTNIEVTVGFVTEHPRAQVRGRRNGEAWEGGDQNCDPGLFWLPHLQLAVPLPWDFVFGFSGSAEYGLGTAYDANFPMGWSSRDTTVQGYVLNPNLAYRITDRWSVGVGLRWLFFDFEQMSDPLIAHESYELGSASTRLKGDNSFRSLGWVVGTKYDVTDAFSVGAVYKSAIDATIEGSIRTKVRRRNEQTIAGVADGAAKGTLLQMGAPEAAWPAYYPQVYQGALAAVNSQIKSGVDARNGDASCDLTLPQSITVGCNWDVTADHHLGFQLSWTQWSVLDSLHFRLAGGDRDVRLHWNDTWRASLGYRWDFADDWSMLLSYVFDQDCCLDEDQTSAMLPPAHRNILTGGLNWSVCDNVDLCLVYNCIFMDGGSFDTRDELGNGYHFETCRGFCHAVGCSVTFRF